MAVSSSGDNNIFINDELREIRTNQKKWTSLELKACHKALIQADIRYTAYKHVVMNIQFSDNYPQTPLLIELKSKTIPDSVLKKMEELCDKELLKYIGMRQVDAVMSYVCEFISSTPFIVCSEEINYIKNNIVREGDELKLKHKAGGIYYKAYQDRYFMEFKLTVPFDYPSTHVQLEFKDSNLPNNLFQLIKGQSQEILRQCIQPPLRRRPRDPPFNPKPSLQLIVNYLVVDSLRIIPTDTCPFCNDRAIPPHPKDVSTDESDPNFVYRIYCGHFYHFKCLDEYMKTPPFTGGKKCVRCGQRVFHDKWNVPPKLAEERWAHQEARKREIAEVAEFLGFD